MLICGLPTIPPRVVTSILNGINNFAEYQLADNMAKNPKNALDLLYGLWEYSIKNAKAEADELQKINYIQRQYIHNLYRFYKLWKFKQEMQYIFREKLDYIMELKNLYRGRIREYAEKLRQEKYDLNEDAIKPYFSQEDVHNGLCTVVNSFWQKQVV